MLVQNKKSPGQCLGDFHLWQLDNIVVIGYNDYIMGNIVGNNSRAVILDAVATFIQREGYSPSLVDISENTGLSLTNVRYHLAKLRDEGRINYNDGVRRSIRIAE